MTAMDPLERALADLGGAIAFPPTPPIARAVRHRIESAPVARRSIARRLWAIAPRTAWVAGSIVALVTGTLVFSPSTREAVADFFGVDGIHIQFGGPGPETVGGGLDLGERISPSEIPDRVPFDVQIPTLESLGPPDEIYFGEPPPQGQLSLVYRAEDGLPPAPNTKVGVLFTQFRADLDGAFFKKTIEFGTNVRPVSIDGAEGYWIHGAPHVFSYRDAAGNFVDETARLAGDVLVWSREGITYRIEAALSLREVVAIAESLEPIAD